MTKRVLLLCLLGMTIVITFYLFSETAEIFLPAPKLKIAPLEEPPASTIDAQVGVPSHTQQPPAITQTDFDSSEKLEKLKAQILDNGAFISPRRRRESFQASVFDTKENTQQAVRTLASVYSDKPSKDEILKRVLALHFLRYSKHLEETECVEMLGSLETQYQAAPNPQIKRATLFDFGSVTYACARFDSSLVEHKIQSAHEPALKAQAKNAQNVYSDELSND